MRGADVILRTGPKSETELPIPLDAIKFANLEYDIRADLQRAKREKKPLAPAKKVAENDRRRRD